MRLTAASGGMVGRSEQEEFDLDNPTFTIDIAAQQEYILLPSPVGPYFVG